MRIARKGFSQMEGGRSAADIHQSRVSEIERDSYSPGLELAQSIANGLDVNLSDMIAVCEGLPHRGRSRRPAAGGKGGAVADGR